MGVIYSIDKAFNNLMDGLFVHSCWKTWKARWRERVLMERSQNCLKDECRQVVNEANH